MQKTDSHDRFQGCIRIFYEWDKWTLSSLLARPCLYWSLSSCLSSKWHACLCLKPLKVLFMLFNKPFYKASFSNVRGVDWIIRITEETEGCFCSLVILCWHWPSFISDSDATLSHFQFLFKQLTDRASCLELKHTSLLIVHCCRLCCG